ncbi:F-box/FBD/LRR-repeat protein [Trifolium medium]|uniref:F-box/FBD/LRR-repeat protein n=1 Tax=Trifolium medium TaxID=97028 RepID=A0A392MLN9_9FABA|nr:F-box/FBD/LRR-repeat protein [Trifolium medium]
MDLPKGRGFVNFTARNTQVDYANNGQRGCKATRTVDYASSSQHNLMLTNLVLRYFLDHLLRQESVVTNNQESSNRVLTLNDLHDDLLKYILSDLPTGKTIETAVVSERFKYLWKGIRKLNFDNRGILQARFMDVVDRILCRFQLSADMIDEFSLLLSHSSDDLNIKRLISSALEDLKVKKFSLKSTYRRMNTLDEIFNCNHLQDLQLSYIRFTLPPLITLSSLRVLILRGTTAIGEPKELILSFPVLTRIEMR